jgi:Tfp pilus assembly protein PilF
LADFNWFDLAPDGHSEGMGHPKKTLLTLLLACSPLFSQINPEELHQAFVLEQQGQFDQVIAMTKPLTDSGQLTSIEIARACITLAVAHEGKGEIAEARNAFERALRILDHDPEHTTDYAAVLDNYAGLYNNAGQQDIAGQMWLKALHLRQQNGDHSGVTRSFMNLAGFALAQNRIREARKYIKQATEEKKQAHDLVDDDIAVLYETEAWLALAEGHASTAVAKYGRSLEIVKRTRGEQHWLTGWDYMLRGKAYAQSDDTQQALADMGKGLSILEHTLGDRNPKYFAAQFAYSQALDRAGSHTEAARLNEAAQRAMKTLYRDQCIGCTINIAAFR